MVYLKRLLLPSSLFFSAFLLTWYLTASYFTASLDEGIYLNGGHRIAEGQILYKDFFAFIGPITYWIEGLLYAIFGNSIPHLRLSTAFSIAAITLGAYTLANTIAGRTAGLVSSALWLSIAIDLPNRMEVNHRWLSLAFYSLAFVVFLGKPAGPGIVNSIVGVLLALSVFTTPSFAVSTALILVYLYTRNRKAFVPVLAGSLAAAILILAILAWQGALIPFYQGILWAMDNYGQANRFDYGRFGAIMPWRYFLQVYLGAIVIPLGSMLALATLWMKRESKIEIPLVFCLALFTTAIPKWDAYSLHFISAPFFSLAFACVFAAVPEVLRLSMRGLGAALCFFFLFNAFTLPDRLSNMPSRAGQLMAADTTIRAFEILEQAIPAKSRVFVYPYMTSLYTLLDVENPARHEFLQPGMMTSTDEDTVLEDLAKTPVDFIFWQDFPDADVRRVWPSSNPDRHRFTRLEKLIREGFEPGVEVSIQTLRGRVWKRR